MKYLIFLVAAVLCYVVEARSSAKKVTRDEAVAAGYEYLRDLGYYKLFTNLSTWDVAVMHCVDQGAHLVIINSEEEANAIRGMINQYTDIRGTWCGITDLDNEGEFVTIFGEPLSSTGYDVWVPGEPNNAGDQDCGLLMRTGGGFDDYECNKLELFICELEI